jgi:hypothetical protein
MREEDVVDAHVEAALVAPAAGVLVAEEVRLEACMEDVVTDVLIAFAEAVEAVVKYNIYEIFII